MLAFSPRTRRADHELERKLAGWFVCPFIRPFVRSFLLLRSFARPGKRACCIKMEKLLACPPLMKRNDEEGLGERYEEKERKKRSRIKETKKATASFFRPAASAAFTALDNSLLNFPIGQE